MIFSGIIMKYGFYETLESFPEMNILGFISRDVNVLENLYFAYKFI